MTQAAIFAGSALVELNRFAVGKNELPLDFLPRQHFGRSSTLRRCR